MNKLGFFVAVVLCQVFSTMTSAQESPFRSCNKTVTPRQIIGGAPAGGTPQLECVVLNDGLVVNDVIFNRNNCPSASTNYANLNNVQRQVLKFQYPLKFGDKFEVGYFCAGGDLIEATIVTNKGNWTFKW